ncbi:MAG: ribonuclease Z [Ruminococcus sp.]|uniref:ribonuclease Z n=1 Tax=Schaedlerella arabinosiphila TaxID=2044587 RepID=UPI00255803A0|nr:ribonuclease Z [Schaedlerella arabinosiphila]MCI9604525.1 ribonuclease Z [Ruminococcus sp.]
MIIIACVDDRNGMMFNNRRQSRDSVVCEDILLECRGKKLYMSSYSGKLFGEAEGADIRISEDILNEAGKGDACFVEETETAGFEEYIGKVILYKWNRRYPADRQFSPDLSDGSWELKRTEEFQGSSHEKVTKEVYERIR